MPAAREGTCATAVIYVHGLWMPGSECALLQRRLWRDRGLSMQVLRFASVRQPLDSVLAALHALIHGLRARQVHLLGHSLGGTVILSYLQRHAMLPPGRVLFMGSPVLGSRAAEVLARWPMGRRLVGGGASHLLQSAPYRRWDCLRELGIIAGTFPLGVGRLMPGLQRPHDGTVAVAETRLPGANAFLTLPVSHMGMLVSERAAREAGSFLLHGRFGL